MSNEAISKCDMDKLKALINSNKRGNFEKCLECIMLLIGDDQSTKDASEDAHLYFINKIRGQEADWLKQMVSVNHLKKVDDAVYDKIQSIMIASGLDEK